VEVTYLLAFEWNDLDWSHYYNNFVATDLEDLDNTSKVSPVNEPSSTIWHMDLSGPDPHPPMSKISFISIAFQVSGQVLQGL